MMSSAYEREVLDGILRGKCINDLAANAAIRDVLAAGFHLPVVAPLLANSPAQVVTPPIERDPCGCAQNEFGDIHCHVCGERVNRVCWRCKTPRGEGPCRASLLAEGDDARAALTSAAPDIRAQETPLEVLTAELEQWLKGGVPGGLSLWNECHGSVTGDYENQERLTIESNNARINGLSALIAARTAAPYIRAQAAAEIREEAHRAANMSRGLPDDEWRPLQALAMGLLDAARLIERTEA